MPVGQPEESWAQLTIFRKVWNPRYVCRTQTGVGSSYGVGDFSGSKPQMKPPLTSGILALNKDLLIYV